MQALLILFVGLATAYLARRATHRAAFQPADLLIGVVGGLVGLSLGLFFGMAESSWDIGLPLLVACGLTLGLSGARTAHA
jgi:hypothetical protein